MIEFQTFLDSPAGVAIYGALVAAFLDLAFGIFAAARSGTFALDAVGAWIRKHLLGRVFPVSVLAIVGYFTENPVMIGTAATALALYAAETLGSVYSSVQEMGSKDATAPIPTD